jgi:hypothetical protein
VVPRGGKVLFVLFLFLATILVLPRSAVAASLTSASVGVDNPFTSATNVRYGWNFTTATSASLTRVTMGVPSGTDAATRYLGVSGATGNNATTADSVANSITGDLDVRVKLAPVSWASGATQRVVSKWKSASVRSYEMSLNSAGKVELGWSTDGTSGGSISHLSTTAVGFSAGTAGWIRATLDVDNGSSNDALTFYTSTDGSSWTQLGAVSQDGSTTTIADSTASVMVGSDSATPTSGSPVNGKIYYAEIRNGINGTVANSFDPGRAAATSASSWSASTGESWTLTRSGSSPADVQADLTVSSVSGIPSGGTADIRFVDGVASYRFSSTAVTAGVVAKIRLTGFINPPTTGSSTSAITTYDTTPAAVDTATASSFRFVTPGGSTANTGSVVLSDSRPGLSSVSYSIAASGVTLSVIKCVAVNFSSSATQNGTTPGGLSASGATLNSSSTWVATPASWSVANDAIGGTSFLSYATGATPASSSNRTIVLDGMTNPTSAGTYFATIATYSSATCTTGAIDNMVIAFSVSDGISLTTTVDPSLLFSVSGYNSGSCNGATITASSSTPTAVPLSHATPVVTQVGGQTLEVLSNAGGGYVMYLRANGTLVDGVGHSIAKWTGTNAAPTSFPAAGTAAFGYTTDHALSGSSTRFQTNKWAGVPTVDEEVSYLGTGGFDETTHVCYQAGISTSTPAGAYSAQITYTVVPTF